MARLPVGGSVSVDPISPVQVIPGEVQSEYTPMDFMWDILPEIRNPIQFNPNTGEARLRTPLDLPDVISPGEVNPNVRIDGCSISVGVSGDIWIYGFSSPQLRWQFNRDRDCHRQPPRPPLPIPSPQGGPGDGPAPDDVRGQFMSDGTMTQEAYNYAYPPDYTWRPIAAFLVPGIAHNVLTISVKKGGTIVRNPLYGIGSSVGGRKWVIHLDPNDESKIAYPKNEWWSNPPDAFPTGHRWIFNVSFDTLPEPPPEDPPPPNDDDDDDDDDMSCCSRHTRMLRRIGQAVGIEDFPASLPRNLADRNTGQTALTSIPQMQAHLLQQIDALLGQFPLEIEIEDINPLEEGNQIQRISLANLAETLGDLYGLLIKIGIETNLGLDFQQRGAIQQVEIKNLAHINRAYNELFLEWLGVASNEKSLSLDYSFNCRNPDKLEELLEDKTAKISVPRLEEKETLLEILDRLSFAAGIIKGANFKGERQIGPLLDALARFQSGEGEGFPWQQFIELLNTDGFVNRTATAPRPAARDIDFNAPGSE